MLVDRANRMIGFRVSIEGLFKSALDIRPYPFDPETRGDCGLANVTATTKKSAATHVSKFRLRF